MADLASLTLLLRVSFFCLLDPCSFEFSLTLRERLRTHKVYTKDQCFSLNYHKFSIKSYVLDVY